MIPTLTPHGQDMKVQAHTSLRDNSMGGKAWRPRLHCMYFINPLRRAKILHRSVL